MNESAVLRGMFMRRKPHTAESDALNSASVALRSNALRYLDYLRQDGGLLFVWHGTKALEGGAA